MQEDMNQLYEKLGHISGKVESIETKVDGLAKSFECIEARIRGLEVSRARIGGIAAVAGAALGFAAGFVERLIFKH